MKGNSHEHNHVSFHMSGLSEQLNPKHPICQLSKIIDWPSLEGNYTRPTAAEDGRVYFQRLGTQAL